MQGIWIFFPRDGPIFTKMRPSTVLSGETDTLPSSAAIGPVTVRESAWIHYFPGALCPCKPSNPICSSSPI